jgi:hypothetical protein
MIHSSIAAPVAPRGELSAAAATQSSPMAMKPAPMSVVARENICA